MRDPSVIRACVRNLIANTLREDLEGGESIMKEAWELCETDQDVEIAREELRRIIEMVTKG